jgi:hypothetical protein
VTLRRTEDEGARIDLDLDLVTVDPPGADVAVSPLESPLTPDFPLPATSKGMTWSQQVFFLGFPYGLATEQGRVKPTRVREARHHLGYG